MTTQTIEQIIKRWDSGEGKPYKGKLIDRAAYNANPQNIGCMCAQGQLLALVGGWDADRLSDAEQREADAETAKLLNISRTHAILLRNVNDRVDGAPSIVLTDPEKVLGDKWSKLLDFWWLFHNYDAPRWRNVATARDAAGDAAWAAAWAAAGDAAWAAAWAAAGDAAGVAAGVAAWVAAWAAAGDAAGDAGVAAAEAADEIQGFDVLGERGHDVFFLPMFGIQTLDDIPARPADYGLGIVPQVAS